MDKRFSNNLWDKWPYYMFRSNYLGIENFLTKVSKYVPLKGDDKTKMDVALRFDLSMINPKSNPLTNPEVLDKSLKSGGYSVFKGGSNFADDAVRNFLDKPPSGTENFVVGKDVATTPGKVVYKTHMFEIIQYKPVTELVYVEPILFVPAWIMKYYIMDLEPKNSMFKWLLEQGHQVFTISWFNPVASDRNTNMEDYQEAITEAINYVSDMTKQKVHTCGYCLGGTMLMIAAARKALIGDDNIASITLMAAQTDFTEAGDVRAFLDYQQITLLEAIMHYYGYLDGKQMGAAFQLMKPDDLIWGKIINEYFMGERTKMNSMMAWNSDTTRMPERFHVEYLHNLFLENQLALGKYKVNNKEISLGDIKVPMFVVGGEQDHVAPWKSVFKVCKLVGSQVIFCLASGGHNQGIITHPSTGKGYHHLSLVERNPWSTPDYYLKYSMARQGSWWTSWSDWVAAQQDGIKVYATACNGISEAPGKYVHVK